MTKSMKENDELLVREVKSAYDEELQVKEKEDIENSSVSYVSFSSSRPMIS